MTANEAKKRIPIKDDLFRVPTNGDPGSLIGTKCKDCGEVFHPKRYVCLNCYSENLEQIDLSKSGKIFTYTITRVSYPGSPVTAPFVTARILMPENVHVLTHITDIDIENVKIGSEVELYFWKSGEDEEGNEIMAYAFKPV